MVFHPVMTEPSIFLQGIELVCPIRAGVPQAFWPLPDRSTLNTDSCPPFPVCIISQPRSSSHLILTSSSPTKTTRSAVRCLAPSHPGSLVLRHIVPFLFVDSLFMFSSFLLVPSPPISTRCRSIPGSPKPRRLLPPPPSICQYCFSTLVYASTWIVPIYKRPPACNEWRNFRIRVALSK
jgi:hypothetical protein